MSHRYSSRRANQTGKMCVTLIVLALIGVMSVQIVNLYQKDQQLIAQEKLLQKQMETELSRQQEIEEYEAYTKTQEYVEEIAKSKLGLVYKDEIIFKEK
ncbi:MAG: septum formation initiator family protein [Eubacterium sp.]|jgi:Septum formation initiator|nr:septum formation initiator family protein [Eubacterium sp.]